MLKHNTILITAGIIIAGVTATIAAFPGNKELDRSTPPLSLISPKLTYMAKDTFTESLLDIPECTYYTPYNTDNNNCDEDETMTSAYDLVDNQTEQEITEEASKNSIENTTHVNKDESSFENSTTADNSHVETQSPVIPQTSVIPQTYEYVPKSQVRPEQSTVPYEETTTKAPAKSGTSNSSYVQQVVDLVNSERAKEGLKPLAYDATLSAAAQKRAEEIVSVFQHTRPDGTQFYSVLKEFGISYRSTGENIAYGQPSATDVMRDWMNSSGHRANIMNTSFEKIGVGVYISPNGTIYWSQLFLK